MRWPLALLVLAVAACARVLPGDIYADAGDPHTCFPQGPGETCPPGDSDGSCATYYRDDDGDGYGETTSTLWSCGAAPAGFSLRSGDCDDGDPWVHPDAAEGPPGDPTCNDGKDNDCDGAIDSAAPTCIAPLPVFRRLVTGRAHTCGLTPAGRVFCWGANERGQLGLGSSGTSVLLPAPVDVSAVAGDQSFVQLAAGCEHTCAVTADGRAYCWGAGTQGQIGQAAAADSLRPQAVNTDAMAAEGRVLDLAAGCSHTCALTSKGRLFCWGANSDGQLGRGVTSAMALSPAQVDTQGLGANDSFIAVSLGARHSCGLTSDHRLACWGAGESGQLGQGSASALFAPLPVVMGGVGPDQRFRSVSAGASHTCGVTVTGLALCWGSGSNGELGNASTSTMTPAPVDSSSIAAGKRLRSVSAGSGHSCAVAAHGRAFCWGLGSSGQLGDGSQVSGPSPREVDTRMVAGAAELNALALGDGFTCGLNAAGLAYCWGDNSHGQLGTGNTESARRPLPVLTSALPRAAGFVQHMLGQTHACGLGLDGTSWCWGSNATGELGSGGGSSLTPVRPLLPAGVHLLSLSATCAGACGLASSGVVYCWGLETSLFLGSTSPSPVDTSGLHGAQETLEVGATCSHLSLLMADGATYSIGVDDEGQLGDGLPIADLASLSPLDTSGMEGQVLVHLSESGLRHQCGIASDGKPYCWGWDDEGQLGDGGSSVNSPSPKGVDVSGLAGDTTFVEIALGYHHTCGLTGERVAVCWGSDGGGRLGDGGAEVSSQAPVLVDTSAFAPGQVLVQLGAALFHSCGRADDGSVYCWGMNYADQLGVGAGGPDQALSPMLVGVATMTGSTSARALYSGMSTLCTIQGDGISYCWGLNDAGQLGTRSAGANAASPAAVDVSGLF